jgi:hypothetical protein
MVGVFLLTRLKVAWLRLALVGLLLIIGVQVLVQGFHS